MKHDPTANHRAGFLPPKARIHPKKPKKSVQGERFSSPERPIEEEGGRQKAENTTPPAFRLLPFGGTGNRDSALQCMYEQFLTEGEFTRTVDFSPPLTGRWMFPESPLSPHPLPARACTHAAICPSFPARSIGILAGASAKHLLHYGFHCQTINWLDTGGVNQPDHPDQPLNKNAQKASDAPAFGEMLTASRTISRWSSSIC